MLYFRRIKIKDFKSIKSAELEYSAGVWQVIGVNNDAVFKSNGSGKTTMLEAIQQCLFNKTTSPTPIEDTGRKQVGTKGSSGIGYEIELEFDYDFHSYRVINSRKAMKIQIFKDGDDLMIKSIPAALKYIQTTIGMDFQTFVTLTFITHDTVVNMLDNFSSSALMKIILNFSQIVEFERGAKAEQKILDRDIASYHAHIQTLEDSLELLNQFQPVNLQPLHLRKTALVYKKQQLADTDGVEIAQLYDTITQLQADIDNATATINKLVNTVQTETCQCCGQSLDTTSAKLQLEVLQDSLPSMKSALSDRQQEYADRYAAFSKEEGQLSHDISVVDNEINIAKTKNYLYEDNKEKAGDLRKKLADFNKQVDDATFRANVIKTALEVLKSGDIQKDLLVTFVSILNVHLAHFMKFVSLDYINVIAKDNKANVTFSIHDSRFNQEVSIHSLSGGEKTRLRLIILLAMLYTIKELASISSNILVFDESLDTLDDSAEKDLAVLFEYLVTHDSKFIALVSHGNQLSQVDFTGTLKAEKTNGVTEITKELHA